MSHLRAKVTILLAPSYVVCILGRGHAIWVFRQHFLCRFPCFFGHLSALLAPRLNDTSEWLRTTDNTLSDCVDVDGNVFTVGIFGLVKVQGPQHLCEAQEERAFCNVKARTDTSSGTKGEMVALQGIGMCCRLASTVEIVLVSIARIVRLSSEKVPSTGTLPLGIKLSRVGVADGVVIECPDVKDNTGTLWNEVPVVCVVF